MPHRFFFVSLGILVASLSAQVAQAETARDMTGDILAYYNGQLVPISLKLMPPSAWDALKLHGERLGEFYDGFACACNFAPPDTVGVCACFQEAPVLRSLDNGLYRAISVYWGLESPGGGGYTAFDQIDSAVSEGHIGVWHGLGVYRLTVRNSEERSEALKSLMRAPQAESTWGSVKAIFR